MVIKELIGEATEYDKKVALEVKKPKSWCKSVSAFANSYGGKLIFGMADDDTVAGLEDAEGDAEKISEAIKAHLNPIPNFKLSFATEDDKKLVALEVEAGNETPYYYEGEGQLVAFVRVGNESVPATPVQLRELVLKGSNRSYDSLKSEFDFSKMAFTKLKSVYYQRTKNDFFESDYESFGIIDEQGNLTNAGALIADESPVRHSRLFCTRWNGLDKASGLIDALDDEEFTGGLVELLQDGIKFIKRNSKKAWRKLPDRRVEYPEYPERAITEGLVNALIHRSYTELGSEVHIDMYDDRLEIYSPGGMMDGSSLENRDLMNIPSKRRNPVIADIFSRLIYMERRGSGFKKILGDYQKQEHYTEEKKPKFDAQRGYFILTLPNLNYLEGQGGTHAGTHSGTHDDTQGGTQLSLDEQIIELVKNNAHITQEEMSKITGVSLRTIKRHTVSIEKIRYVGSGDNGHWEVIDGE